MSTIKIVEANLDDRIHAAGILQVLKQYAAEPGGGGESLPAETESNLISRLKEQTQRLVLIALHDDGPIGVAICFRGFSTFQAKPLINIHDLAVMPGYRGQGAGRKLIERVKTVAQNEGCCRVTLEVYNDNSSARRLYQRCGFNDPPHGKRQTLFLSHPLVEQS